MSNSSHRKSILGTILAITVIGVGLMRCSDKIVDPGFVDIGYGYFPLDTGLYREYMVRLVSFSGEKSDTSTWYYRDTQKYWFTDQAGDSVLVIVREKRIDTTEDWAPDSLIQVKRSSRRLIVTENNIPYIKMVFPVADSLQWNGNAYNTLTGQDDYYYKNVGQSRAVLDTIYHNTLTVIEQDIEDPIVNQVKKDEIYADGVGLIYREKIDYRFCQDQDCLGQGIIEYGSDYRQWILKYGYE